MSAGWGVGGPDRLNTGQPGPGLEQPATVDEPAATVGRSVSSQRSLCRLWNSLCPPESNRKGSVSTSFFLFFFFKFIFELAGSLTRHRGAWETGPGGSVELLKNTDTANRNRWCSLDPVIFVCSLARIRGCSTPFVRRQTHFFAFQTPYRIAVYSSMFFFFTVLDFRWI